MTAPRTFAAATALTALLMTPMTTDAQDQGKGGPVLLPVPDDPTISFMVWFKVGSQDDPPGKEGLAYLTGQMISQGATTANSYEEILKKLYPLAAGYGVRVDREMTTLGGRIHKDNLTPYYALFTDAYLKPAFKQEDFERLRSDQLNFLEKTLRYASDEELGKAALMSFVYDGTGYRHPPEGTVQGLKSITLDDVKRFYAERYTRNNAVVALGGGYTKDLADRFAASLASLPAGAPKAKPAPTPKPIQGRQALLVNKPGADASISFGFPIDVKRGDRDFYALWLANSWLGEHRNSSSHLYQVIREARGLNYGDYSYVEAYPEGGQRQMPPPNVARRRQLFEVWIRTLPNAQAHFALRAAMHELTDLVENGMTKEEFELTRSFLKKYSLHYAETTGERLGYAVDDRFYGIGEPGHLKKFHQVLDSLTREEVNAALKKHLKLANMKFAIVTGEAEAMAKALEADAPSPITYPAEKPAEILEEDKAIVAFPLKIADATVVPVEQIFEK